jgi:hypothetical protein
MKPITASEILALADYERVHARLRPLFIHEKDPRCVALGSHLDAAVRERADRLVPDSGDDS